MPKIGLLYTRGNVYVTVVFFLISAILRDVDTQLRKAIEVPTTKKKVQ